MLKIKRQVTANIDELDKKIGELAVELGELETDSDTYQEDYEMITQKMETLTDLRVKLKTSKVDGSIVPVVTSSLLGIASLIIVLQYEDENVITSKAIGMLPNLFRGSK
jgi:broad-specificity NMP kinase